MKLHHDGMRYMSNISAASVAMVSHPIRPWRLIQPLMRMNYAIIQQRQFVKQRQSVQAIARRRSVQAVPGNRMMDWFEVVWSEMDWSKLWQQILISATV